MSGHETIQLTLNGLIAHGLKGLADSDASHDTIAIFTFFVAATLILIDSTPDNELPELNAQINLRQSQIADKLNGLSEGGIN